MVIKNKKALEMSFAWIFAIAVGAIILILAIYFATNLVRSGYNQNNVVAARELVNVLDPLQTSVEETKAQRIDLTSDTKIYNYCDVVGDFGTSKVEVSEKNSFGGDKWSKPGGDIKTESQYLFSEDVLETRRLYFFITSFKIPFKAADLMVMYSDNYCFINPPDNIKDEITGLTNKENSNIDVKLTSSGCENNSVKVCFIQNSNCDIIVEGNCNGVGCNSVYDMGVVIKNNTQMSFIEGLMYAGIFSSQEIYECNVQRIMKRVNGLSSLYLNKAKLVSAKGCDTNLEQDLSLLSDASAKLRNSKELFDIKLISGDIKAKNVGVCNLF